MTEARKQRVRRTKEEKLRIIEECRKRGIVETCKKYGIYPASYYAWVERFALDDIKGAHPEASKEYLKEIRRLEKENAQLRSIMAQKDLESAMKDELLKKKYGQKKSGK